MNGRDDPTAQVDARPDSERELERYADTVRGMPSGDFVDRVMSSVDEVPAPGRGLFGRLPMMAPGWHGPLRAAAVAAVVVIAIGGALAASQLLGTLRDAANPVSSPSPSIIAPTMTVSPSPSETPQPPTPSPSPTATTAPTETPDSSESQHVSETPQATDDHGGGGGGGSSGPGGGGGLDDPPGSD